MRNDFIRAASICGAAAFLAGAPLASASGQISSVSTSPCSTLSADSAIARVQSSTELREALRALAEGEAALDGSVDDARIQRLCAAMATDTPQLLDGVTLVHAPAVFLLERSFMIFALEGDRVFLLNPRPDGVFRFGLDSSDWNEFLDATGASLKIDDPAAAAAYACLLLTYLQNYMPGPACSGPMDARISRVDNGSWGVEIPPFRWHVAFDKKGRVLENAHVGP